MRQSNDLRTRAIHVATLALCGLCFGLVPHSQVMAASAPVAVQDSAFGRFMSLTTGAGVETVSFGKTGTPLVAKGDPTLSIDTNGGMSNHGRIVGNREGILRLPGGTNLPVKASAPLVGSVVAKTILGAAKAVPVIGTAIYLMDLFAEMKYRVSKKPDGSLSVETLKKTGGKVYRTRTWDLISPQERTAARSPAESCNIAIAEFNVLSAPNGYSHIFLSADGVSCAFKTDQANPFYINWGQDSYLTPDGEIAEPSSEAALESDIQRRQDITGWPDTSSAPKAVAEAIKQIGGELPTEGPKVSGPPSVEGQKEVTSNPIPNGTRETTKQTSFDCTYANGASVMDGGIVSCTQKETVTAKDTVTNPETGATTQTATTTGTTTKPADTTAEKPAVDECEANPDRIGCGTLDTPEGEIPKITKTFTYQAEDLGLGNGSCPAPTTVSTSNGSYTLDLGQYCDAITTFVRPVVILFGMLAAFFIAIPVKTEGA